MRNLPIGIQDFQKLREGNFIYVDKTSLIYKLAKNSTPYFLSRPRRFGKSLLISTLEAYFLGKKELFQGLAIENLETEWKSYPVLKFSLAGGDFSTKDGLENSIQYILSNFEKMYDIDSEKTSLSVRFASILKNTFEKTGKPVVVLVDEYDNPLLKALDKEQEEYNRRIFKSFFAVLKDCDAYTRFVFFTGVTKFSKVSIFSDLNQLNDISMDNQFASICGITQIELEEVFVPEIDELAKYNTLSKEQCLSKLKALYDGYKFSKHCVNIYNPFSLLNAFYKKEFGKYWFSTGTPTFLVQRFAEIGFNPQQFTDGTLYTSEDEINDYRPDNPDIIPLLYQSGYLTLKEYDSDFDSFTIGFPNEEVKYGFTTSLTPVYLNTDKPLDIRSFAKDIKFGNLDSLKERFVSVFARLPYATVSNDKKESVIEQNFQNVIYLVFLLLGQFAQVEQHSAKGRADCIVETGKYVYIFEFKKDSSAKDALKQIEENGYALPYAADSRIVYKIGVNFSSTICNLSDWQVE